MSRGGKRPGAGRKVAPEHLRRSRVSIRLPNWMIEQIKSKGEIAYIIEYELAKKEGFLKLPEDYKLGS